MNVNPESTPEKAAGSGELAQAVAHFSRETAPEKQAERNLFLQYNGLEFSDKLMFEASIRDYCDRTGISEKEITAVNLYVKPEEGKAYYVIDHDSEKTGSIEL